MCTSKESYAQRRTGDSSIVTSIKGNKEALVNIFFLSCLLHRTVKMFRTGRSLSLGIFFEYQVGKHEKKKGTQWSAEADAE